MLYIIRIRRILQFKNDSRKVIKAKSKLPEYIKIWEKLRNSYTKYTHFWWNSDSFLEKRADQIIRVANVFHHATAPARLTRHHVDATTVRSLMRSVQEVGPVPHRCLRPRRLRDKKNIHTDRNNKQKKYKIRWRIWNSFHEKKNEQKPPCHHDHSLDHAHARSRYDTNLWQQVSSLVCTRVWNMKTSALVHSYFAV